MLKQVYRNYFLIFFNYLKIFYWHIKHVDFKYYTKKSYLTYKRLYTQKHPKMTKKYNFDNDNNYKIFLKKLHKCFI